MAVLQSHEWPGNVRQLRNNIERLMILVGGDPDTVVTSDMLPDEIISPGPLSPNGAGGENLMSSDPLTQDPGIGQRWLTAVCKQPSPPVDT
jgi:DNA-binding NtrC family response regulator